jgi:hypothetical protein
MQQPSPWRIEEEEKWPKLLQFLELHSDWLEGFLAPFQGVRMELGELERLLNEDTIRALSTSAALPIFKQEADLKQEANITLPSIERPGE